ncbi:MAG: hypothetical protein SFW67_15955 [Myxococcaceae bacterium]|nr:hypothetical protein [Myxococcaceae bacterium]
MTRWIALAGLFVALAAPEAAADKLRGRLPTYSEDTTEVRDLNKRPSKVKEFTETDEQPPESFQFPWKQLLGTLLCFALAAPFAWRLFRNVNDEIASAKDNQQPVRVRRKLTSERPSTEG